jgi:4-amino-4-deoxy-L-arabinose transferase-like glycosyltransferase
MKTESKTRVWIIFACAFLALALRLYFTNVAVVEKPISGDARDYTNYAWNLINHSVFSNATPSPATPRPDSYRDPGYPVFLAAIVSAFPTGWYGAVRTIQCLLGAMTVLALLAAARDWLRDGWLLAAGLLMAVWPHCITISTYLLSETLFGFFVALALTATNEALRRPDTRWACAAGFMFGAAAVTNAVLIPFAPVIAAYFAWRSPTHRRQWLALALCAVVLPAAWLGRNATLDAGQSAGLRASTNFVQGSWPSYHAAAHGVAAGDEASKRIMGAIDGEIAELARDRPTGLRDIYGRLRATPFDSVAWYASKPALLWSWNLQIASGHIYPFATSNSPLQAPNALHAIVQLLVAMNGWIAVAALAGCVLVACRRSGATAWVTSTLLLYVTAVYGVLQSEPRYTIAFRGEEILMAIFTVMTIVKAIHWPHGAVISRLWRTASQFRQK